MFNRSESFFPILKKMACMFSNFKEEQSFPWGACSSAGRAIVKRER